MKIIRLGRGQGKTMRLLYASEFNNATILCSDHKYKKYLMNMARELGLNIPEPVAVSEVVSEIQKRSDVIDRDILVDEAHWVLQCLLNSLGMRGEIKAITLPQGENTYE